MPQRNFCCYVDYVVYAAAVLEAIRVFVAKIFKNQELCVCVLLAEMMGCNSPLHLMTSKMSSWEMDRGELQKKKISGVLSQFLNISYFLSAVRSR